MSTKLPKTFECLCIVLKDIKLMSLGYHESKKHLENYY